MQGSHAFIADDHPPKKEQWHGVHTEFHEKWTVSPNNIDV
jgi:hypothetical protein